MPKYVLMFVASDDWYDKQSKEELDKAYRAAAGAIGDNPIPIVVPCHRVVASDGTLGGYAGGLEAKRHLLKLERGVAVPPGGWPPAHLHR